VNHEPANIFPLADFAARVVWAGVAAARHDPTEMKQRMMIAYEHGHITAAEMDVLIPALGLTEA
jgi:hypothetical protein